MISNRKHKIYCSKQCYITYNKQINKQKNRSRYKNDNIYKLSISLRNRFKMSLKAKNINKKQSIFKLLGCTIYDYYKYLESKFLPGMTWGNYEYYGWHIDHIISINKFDLNTLEGQQKAFHYTNTQPLWMKDNMQKSSKM